MESEAWVSPWWQAACLPSLWDVAGIKVPSLSVWHTFALESIGNPYLCEGGMPDRDAAASLLLFASRGRDAGRKLVLVERERERAVRDICRDLRGEWSDIDAACREYVNTCLRAPRRWQKKETTGKPYHAPYQWHLVRLLSRFMPYQAAWDFPYSEARCIFDAQAEADGDESLMSPAQQQKDDEAFAIMQQREAVACPR